MSPQAILVSASATINFLVSILGLFVCLRTPSLDPRAVFLCICWLVLSAVALFIRLEGSE